MQLLTATAKGKARQVNTRYGDRLVLDALGQDGREYTIWRPGTDNQLPRISNGERISLGIDSQGKCHLLETPANTPTEPATTANDSYSLDKESKQAIAAYITQQKDLLQFCWQQAETIEGPQTEDSIEKLAVTLYLSAQRKFGLA